MSVWPPDGLWRITVPSGSTIPISVPAGGVGSWEQPVPTTGSPAQFPLVVANATAISASGNTAVWTPSGGTTRFNLMGFCITISGNASRAAGSATIVQLRDGATNVVFACEVFIPGAAGTTMGNDIVIGPTHYGAPFRSAAIANALNLNLQAALATGQAACSAWGFETV